jgi:flagellar biosynthesis protein FlhF
MKIKKFSASDTKVAMQQVKDVLGDHAIILHVQEKSDPKSKKRFVEVTAALDDDYKKNNNIANQLFTSVSNNSADSISRIHTLLGKSERPTSSSHSFSNQDPFIGQTNTENFSSWREFEDVKSQLASITTLLQNNGYPEFPPKFMDVYAELVSKGVEKRLAAVLLRKVERELKSNAKVTRKLIKGMLGKNIEKFVSEFDTIHKNEQSGKKIKAFIGPTGVGKTTCIAKLSAIDTVYKNRKVGLISTDTYRIGAIEQLKTYANITKAPLEVVYSPNEMKHALARLQDMEIIYIDTPGRSQKNLDAILELTKFLDRCPNLEINLVMSLTSNLANLQDILTNYSILPIDNLLFTKYDETETAGNILNIIHQAKKPVSFISTGQNVPEDIKEVNAMMISNMIMGEKKL